MNKSAIRDQKKIIKCNLAFGYLNLKFKMSLFELSLAKMIMTLQSGQRVCDMIIRKMD